MILNLIHYLSMHPFNSGGTKEEHRHNNGLDQSARLLISPNEIVLAYITEIKFILLCTTCLSLLQLTCCSKMPVVQSSIKYYHRDKAKQYQVNKRVEDDARNLLELLLWEETAVPVFCRRSLKVIVFLLVLKNNPFFGMIKRTNLSTQNTGTTFCTRITKI